MKNKIPTFIFGVAIGLLIGIIFFIFKINEVFIELKETSNKQISISEKSNNTFDKTDNDKKNNERFKINSAKTIKINSIEFDSLINKDSEINIATEEMLSSKNVKIIKVGSDSKINDTLVSKLAGVEENISDIFLIEFWKTPLNSKGYRFTKNKILLYGFFDFNNVILYELENSIYLKSSGQLYKLLTGSDFKQLEIVIDTDLLAKIN